MVNFFSQNYFYSLDYLLFIVGIIITTVAILAIAISNKSRIFAQKRYVYLFVAFLFMVGFNAWLDFLISIFSSYSLYQNIHYIAYFITYILLLELGRSLVFKSKKSLFIYFIFAFLFIIGVPLTIINNLMGLIGSVMLIYSLHYRVIFLENNRIKYKPIITFFFIILSIFYMIFILVHIFTDTLLLRSQLHLAKHAMEWIIVLIIAELGIFNIKGFVGSDPIETQIKKLKERLTKLTVVTFIIFALVGFFIVNYAGNLRFEYYKDALLESTKLASLSIEGSYHKQLESEYKGVRDYTNRKIRNTLEEFKTGSRYIDELFTVINNNGTLSLGVYRDKTQLKNDELIDEITTNHEKTIRLVLSSGEEHIDAEPSQEKHDQWLTAFAPIKNYEGEITGLLGIHYSYAKVMNSVKLTRFMSMLFLSFIYTIFAILAYVYYKNQRERAWKNYHKKILSSIGDIVGVFDNSYRLIYVNDAAYRLTGGDARVEIKTQSLWDYLPVDEYRRLKELLEGLEENQISYGEFTLLDIHGGQIPVYASITYLGNKLGEPLYVFTAMNITEQKMREEVIKENFKTSLSLIATVIDAKDGYTALHSINVAKYAKLIAKELGFTNEKVKEIETAAIVHDIGKVGVVDSILNKAGKLTEDEWEEMKRHPEYGKLILEKAGDTFKHLIPYVYYHHERYDGKGYPTGMLQPPVPISIISVADAFDAMTSDRAYRKALTIDDAREQLKKFSGTQFHPEVVQAFLRVIKNMNSVEDLN